MQVEYPKAQSRYFVADIQVNQTGVQIWNKQTGEQEIVTHDMVSEYLVPVLLPGKTFQNVKIGIGGTYLKSVSPSGGKFLVRFKSITKGRNDAFPTPTFKPGGETKTGRGGRGTYTTRDKEVFNVSLEVLAGPYAGLGVVTQMPYAFKRGNDNNITIGVRDGMYASKRVIGNLVQFLEVQLGSISALNYPYGDGNFLPTLEDILRMQGAPFLVQIQEGWVTEFDYIPSGMTAESYIAAMQGVAPAPAAAPLQGMPTTQTTLPQQQTQQAASPPMVAPAPQQAPWGGQSVPNNPPVQPPTQAPIAPPPQNSQVGPMQGQPPVGPPHTPPPTTPQNAAPWAAGQQAAQQQWNLPPNTQEQLNDNQQQAG